MSDIAALAHSWVESEQQPHVLQHQLASALAASDDASLAARADELLALYRSEFADLESRARAAFSTGAACTGSAFHSAPPDPVPFVLYRLPSILRTAGLYAPSELEALRTSSELPWVARLVLRHLAALAAVRGAVRDLLDRRTQPAAFPDLVTDLVHSATAVQPAIPSTARWR